MIRVIRDDAHAVMTISARPAGYAEWKDVCFSLPRVLGSKGVEATLYPVLDASETEAIQRSAQILDDAAKQLAIKAFV